MIQDIPAQMRAAVYHGRRDIRFERLPVPSPGEGELLLEVGTVGVCGTDVGEWASGPHQHPVERRHPVTGWLGPVTPGHEFSGTVVGVGAGLDEAAWLGHEVAASGTFACGRCERCLRGESNQCAGYASVGLHRPGALAEYVVTPALSAVRTDDRGLSLDEAALCQPMSIAVHSATRAGEVAGRTCLVQGVGGIGAFLVAALVGVGADVIAVDRDPDRLELARSLGARAAHRVTGDDDPATLRSALVGEDIRVVFEVSGSASGVETALAIAPRGCRIVLVGIQKHPVAVDLGAITIEERILIGTNALVRETDLPRAVDLIAARHGEWATIAPRVLPLDQLVEGALRPMSEGRPTAIKTLIDPRALEPRPLR